MRLANTNDIKAILEYLKQEVHNCLYMYIDIGKYGIEDQFMNVWIDESEGDISCVVMKYHTGLSVYSDADDWDIDSIVEIIKKENIKSITARKDICSKLYEQLKDDYTADYGYVYEFTKYHPINMDVDVERAGEKDMMALWHIWAR